MVACGAARATGLAELQRAVRALPGMSSVTFRPSNYFDCLDAGRGAWMVGVEQAALRRYGTTPFLIGGLVFVTYFTEDGSALRAPATALGEHRLVATRPPSYVELLDLDDDGARELALVATPADQRSLRVLAVRGGSIVTVEPTTAIRPTSLEDVDRDRQKDLLETVTFVAPQSCVEQGILATQDVISWVAIRERAGFRADSDGARAWVRLQCPERPTVFVPSHGVTTANVEQVFEQMLRRISCGRAWGMSAEAIGRAFPSRWPVALSCVSRAELLTFAASLRPPVTLSPMQPSAPPRASAETNVSLFDPGDFIPPRRRLTDVSPALARVCAASERAVSSSFSVVLRQSRQMLTQEELDEFFGSVGKCFTSEVGDAWVTALPRLRWIHDSNDGESGLRGASRILHVDASGRVVGQGLDTVERFESSMALRQVISTFDYDGDRVSEAFVWTRASGDELDGDGRSELDLLTVARGVVTRYAPAGGVPPFRRVVDIDEDGRPDLLDTRCHELDSEEPSAQQSLGCLAHSRADGTFSRDDSVARDFAQRQCTAPPERLVTVTESSDRIERDETLAAIVCARYYDESSERLVHRIFLESRGYDEDDLRWLKEAARAALWRMPFTLTSRRPSAPVQRADAGVAP